MPHKNIRKLAIIAGSGMLPKHVVDSCKKKKIPYTIIGLAGHTEIENFGEESDFELFNIHSISKILKSMMSGNVSHVTLCGKVSRTSIPKLMLDLKGAKLLASIIKNGLADSDLLGTIIKFLESEGFAIIAPELIASEIVLHQGNATKLKPSDNAYEDIKRGLQILKGVASFDVGQALVIQSGLVLGVEAAEGTDELIKRCGEIKQQGEGPILIKICKPFQDLRVDLPCIGPKTVELAAEFGFAGIAAEAEKTLMLDPVKTIKLAEKLKIFIYGV